MKPNRYRVYAATLVLMVLGALSQWLLLNGPIPFSRTTQGGSVLEVPGRLGEQLGLWTSQKGEETGAEIRPLRPQFQTGVVFPQWGTNAYSTTDPNWQIGLKDIQEQTGAGWIELPVNFYQSTIYSTQVMTTDQTPTVKAVVAGIRAARAKGFHVFVVPLLSVEEAGVLSWAGSIQFASQLQTQAWFDSYWQAFQPYVAASAQAGADELAIGTEFELLQKMSPAFWNQLIGRIHAVYHGPLTYDLNWSSLYYPLPAWLYSPYLSAIGVSMYVPLTDLPQRLSPETISLLWREKIKTLLDTFAVEVKKPVIITEIGYRNSAYALYRPWYRDAPAATEPVDPAEQAAAYDAALRYSIGDSHISGIFFWAWSMPLFEPNWLSASKILHKWYTSYLA